LAAKLAAEACERVRVPAVVGEIVVGVLIGPSLLGWVAADSEPVLALAELGVLLLLVQVGMEMDLAELGALGRASMLVALIGVAVPFAFGGFVGLGFGESGDTALFVGAALTATSVGITARVFGDLRALATTEARIVLGAAVADDVLGLVILTIVVKVVTEGSVGPAIVAETVGAAVAFLVVATLVGVFVVPWCFEQMRRISRSAATVVVLGFALTLGFAWAATLAKLAPIIGAFVAGLAIGRSREHARIERDFAPTANLLIPVFFVQIGLDADVEAMARPAVLGLAGALVVVAIIGKLMAGVGARGVRADWLLIGLGMIPRGEVGIIFASIGLAEGVLGDDQYAALLIMVLATTLLTPPLLRWRVGQLMAADEPIDAPGEWEVGTVGDRIVLRGAPGSSQLLHVALDVARLAPIARPDAGVIDWFGRHRNAEVSWGPTDTDRLIPVLRGGDARSWRFLDVTGVLERALPEVSAALERRRTDAGELDPTRVLRLPTVELVGHDADRVALLGALVSDVCETGASGCATSLAARLDPVRADEIIAVVEGASLLRAAVGDPDGFSELRVLQLAEHLSSKPIADDAHRLASAHLTDDDWRRGAVDELHRLVVDALSHPALGDGESTPAEARRVSALAMLDVRDQLARSRLEAAPATFLLAHDPVELARQARLVEPLPMHGDVRVAVSPDPDPDHWRIDVSCRDRAGLLSRLTRALADAGLHVAFASLVTWPDGGVLDSFVVASSERPNPRDLSGRMQRALRGRRPPTVPIGDVEVTFEDDAAPWFTVCVTRGPDRPGLLAAIASALDDARVDVHAARVASAVDAGVVDNRFEVTDRHGRKLDAGRKAAVRRALGVAG
jgi:Kef-type K+ transport system membrane component KefB/predicted amino acid-binding ACT domain protein